MSADLQWGASNDWRLGDDATTLGNQLERTLCYCEFHADPGLVVQVPRVSEPNQELFHG
jgi:hypothetical protein